MYYINHLILTITPLLRCYNLNFKDEEIDKKRVSTPGSAFLELPGS